MSCAPFSLLNIDLSFVIYRFLLYIYTIFGARLILRQGVSYQYRDSQ